MPLKLKVGRAKSVTLPGSQLSLDNIDVPLSDHQRGLQLKHFRSLLFLASNNNSDLYRTWAIY